MILFAWLVGVGIAMFICLLGLPFESEWFVMLLIICLLFTWLLASVCLVRLVSLVCLIVLCNSFVLMLVSFVTCVCYLVICVFWCFLFVILIWVVLIWWFRLLISELVCLDFIVVICLCLCWIVVAIVAFCLLFIMFATYWYWLDCLLLVLLRFANLSYLLLVLITVLY